ncbi:MAG: 2-C-methyl-D-erythritol 4-phosphate cytidylyltransferase [Clostridia bacterium]|nr:2-C-methyl-D-erythritol 4-phosphate cytidylyltransferase [Clostridia bacterium]
MSKLFKKLADTASNAIDKITLKHFKPKTAAIITVGGSGKRMETLDGITKQFMELNGLPIVARTLIEFENSPYIDEIVIVSKEDEIGLYTRMIEEHSLSKVRRIVKGGNTRQESVLNGFKAISEKCEYVAIHDGVRCLITQENIKAVIKNAYATKCACAATKIYDTLKMANSDMFIDSTPNRSRAWAAQTPQVFKSDIYRACAYSAKKEGLSVTDDCMLVEYYGFKIKLVDCGRNNIKITTKDDLIIAEAILNSRNTEGENL